MGHVRRARGGAVGTGPGPDERGAAAPAVAAVLRAAGRAAERGGSPAAELPCPAVPAGL